MNIASIKTIEGEVVMAARLWWLDKRPIAWSKRQHIENSTINCNGAIERALGKWCGILAEAVERDV